jgi:hypothetical protein
VVTRVERAFDDQPMRLRQDDIDPPMAAVGRRRHPSRRHLGAMEVDWQEHRLLLDRGSRREPGILEPLED